MLLIFSHKGKYIELSGVRIKAWVDVRSIENGRRRPDQVVYTIPGKHPYDPKPFPLGRWNVQKPVPKTDPYMAPYFIPTDAWRSVKIWSTANGKYSAETAQSTVDKGYGIHFSTSDTTLGCIRVATEVDIVYLVHEITRALNAGEVVEIEVKE